MRSSSNSKNRKYLFEYQLLVKHKEPNCMARVKDSPVENISELSKMLTTGWWKLNKCLLALNSWHLLSLLAHFYHSCWMQFVWLLPSRESKLSNDVWDYKYLYCFWEIWRLLVLEAIPWLKGTLALSFVACCPVRENGYSK